MVRIINKTLDMVAGIGATKSLHRELPDFAACWESSTLRRRQLLELHQEYVTDVSSADMAISPHLAEYLYVLLETRRPRRIVDLGSGFSSVVLRQWAQDQHDVQCASVDDSQQWLDATRDYLDRSGVRSDQLYSWEAFSQLNESYDFVLHDLGRMELRAEALASVVQMVDHSVGILVIDDMHKREYRYLVRSTMKAANMRLLELRTSTLDDYGRWFAIAFPESE